MLILLLSVIALSLGLSFLCSLMEAAILTVPLSYAKSKADQASRTGQILLRWKKDISAPISAILILNTISHTVGATVSGALVDKMFGDKVLALFSIFFTLLILYLSEIIPKQIGVVYHKPLSLLFVRPLNWLIAALYPIIQTTKWASSWIGGKTKGPSVSVQELLSMTKMGEKENVIDPLESSVISNVIQLENIMVRDIATPRSVVIKAPESMKLEDILDKIDEWNPTRIPLMDDNDPDRVVGYVHQRDLLLNLMKGNVDLPISNLKRNLDIVTEMMPIDRLFERLIDSREPIRAVVDEYGVFAGLVTLEDVIEVIVGKEIVDEHDIIHNLRTYAKVLYNKRRKQEEGDCGFNR